MNPEAMNPMTAAAPTTINRILNRLRKDARRFIRQSPLYVRHRSELDNLYHCCVVRSGSHWIRGILRDPVVYRYSGLGYYNYYARFAASDNRPTSAGGVDRPMPRRKIVSPLYFNYSGFHSIPRTGPYRAIFVTRDPRDLVVSWYFSIMYSHQPIGRTPEWRRDLHALGKVDGLRYSIDAMADEVEVFDWLLSWLDAEQTDPNVLVVRFEDLVGDDRVAAFRRIFVHCGIPIPDQQLPALLARHSFRELTGGRKPGEEDVKSHFRKGEPGDWRNHLDAELLAYLDARSDSAAARLGYA